MKRISLLLALAASVAAAQTSSTPARPAGAAAAKTGTAGAAAHPAVAGGPKLPPGVPPARGLLKTAFALRYQDIKLGTGAVAEPMKLYKVDYTGWLAADGKKFDSSYDHKRPVTDKDGKPETDADGKPKMGEAEPIEFPQGRRAVIPGWDQGFEGMKIGGKRRLFIPYQLAYGANGRPPVIPAKADLIFDVEFVDQRDVPAQQMPPGGGRQMEMRQRGVPGTPGSGASPGATPPAANPNSPPGSSPATTPGATTPPPATPSGQPADPTAPTQAPNSATPPPPPPDKPTNPKL